MTERRVRIIDLATHPEIHVTMTQVMEYFNVDRRTVLKWIEAGTLVAYKPGGGEWRFKVRDLHEFETKSRVAGSDGAQEATHP